jgi:hypothetical protein
VLNLVNRLAHKGAGLRVLEPGFCTSTHTGCILVVSGRGMVAEMERRVHCGVLAVSRLLKTGRLQKPPAFKDASSIRELTTRGLGPTTIAEALGIGDSE